MSQNSALRRSVVLKHRPDGAPRREHFEIREDAVPQPTAGEVVTRTIWLSIDPYMRGRLREQQTYAQPVNPGDVMTGESVELMVRSQRPDEMGAYERLIGDAMRGDSNLFARADSVEAAWRIVEPILGEDSTPIYEYDKGSWGPSEANYVLHGNSRWFDPKKSTA